MKREYTRDELSELRIRRNRIRRQRQLRRRIALALAALVIIMVSSFGITSFISKAQTTNEILEAKCYTSVRVEYGSCLSTIAEDYIDTDYYDSIDEYINEIIYINHLDNTDIKAGTYLILPIYQSV